MTKVTPNIRVPAVPAIFTKYTRKSKLNIRQNQDPPEVVLFERGVQRRVALIVGRNDRENLVPGTNVTMDALQRYQLAGRRLQARAVASALTGLLRAVVRPVKELAARLDGHAGKSPPYASWELWTTISSRTWAFAGRTFRRWWQAS
jgi:hypothetical protein